MQTVYSERHAGHGGNVELMAGEILPAFEVPRRAEIIRARVEEVGLGPVLAPEAHELDAARRVHAPDYLDFLPRAWPLWAAAGRSGTAMPFVWPVPGLRADVPPADIEGLLGFYAMDGGATFVAGTWDAIKASHDVALTAAGLVQDGADAAFALCRPPGHHAGRRFAGGYCFINNAAVAAEWLRGRGAARVSVLDIDYHHGNGTQAIFYDRADVQVVNVHADPMVEYPYFLGHADERGTGEGEGCNLNLPLPHGTDFAGWSAALAAGCAAVAEFAPEVLVVSLGVDTFRGDPISRFRLETRDYPVIGGADPRAGAADALRDGGRLCGGGDRGQRRGRADRLRGPLNVPAPHAARGCCSCWPPGSRPRSRPPPPPDLSGAQLRIGTRVAPPFAMRGVDGRWEGISIALLAAIAERLHFRYDLVETSLKDMVDGVAAGRLDASIAAMSVTQAREKVIDFSNPYFHSGLGVAVAAVQRASFLAVLDALSSRTFLVTLAALVALLLGVGALAWLAERRHNPGQFEAAAARGLFSGFWWAAVTMTTVGYGDKSPVTVAGRLLGILWMFSAVILTSLVTAQLSATLTAERIVSRVTTVADLSKVRVGNVADSASIGPLHALGVRPIGYPDIESGLAALTAGKIDAFVHDEPILVWLRDSVEGVTIAPLRFAPEDYAIVLPEDSPYREAINQALLEVLASDQWPVTLRYYLGPDA